MKKISVRLANESDAEKFVEFEKNTPNNLWDAASGLYPSSFTLVADNGDPQLYLPVQRPFYLESIGRNPKADDRTFAVSMRRLMDAVMDLANQSGTGEVYFVCSEDSTCEFSKRHGFEELPYRLFRMRVKDYK